MNISELTLVQTWLNALIGLPLCAAAREADMLLLSFGGEGLETQLTLRIQCYYRMMEQGGVILARNDVYQPAEGMWQMWEQMTTSRKISARTSPARTGWTSAWSASMPTSAA